MDVHWKIITGSAPTALFTEWRPARDKLWNLTYTMPHALLLTDSRASAQAAVYSYLGTCLWLRTPIMSFVTIFKSSSTTFFLSVTLLQSWQQTWPTFTSTALTWALFYAAMSQSEESAFEIVAACCGLERVLQPGGLSGPYAFGSANKLSVGLTDTNFGRQVEGIKSAAVFLAISTLSGRSSAKLKN